MDSRTDTTLTIDWDDATNATGYIIQWREDGGSWSNTVQATPAASTYEIGSLSANQEYNIRVRATRTDANNGNWSSTLDATTLPAAPTGLTLTAGPNNVSADWDDVSGATGYGLEYSTTGGGSVTTVSVSSSTYNITSLALNTEYQVRVRAVVSGANSAWTSYSMVTTEEGTLGQVGGLALTDGTGSDINAAWTTLLNAATYRVQWRTDSGTFGSTNETTASTTSVTLTPLDPHTQYHVRVRGEADNYADGAWSSVSNRTSGIPVPGNVTTAVTSSSIAVSWDSVDSSATYELRYRLSPSGAVSNVLTISGTSHTITSLTRSTDYDVRVRAKISTAYS